jgi:uncharacterized protein (TIGR03083 family)
MSELGVQGYRAEREAILEVATSLSADELRTPSDCAGWATRDVLAHLAASIHGVVDPAFLVDMSNGAEQAMEGPVAERRAWPIEQVLEEYETYSAQAADAFASLQAPPMADMPLPMMELGTHPMAILPGCFLFDSYCHLRNDILAPNGSIDRPEPPRDEQRLQPTLEWMLAGLPWMCADQLGPVVTRPLVLDFTGPGGGSFTVTPGDAAREGRVVIAQGAAIDAAATVTSSTHDFVVWGTRRRPWGDFVKVSGDDAYAAPILDAVNVI